jgi:hypothetical protein
MNYVNKDTYYKKILAVKLTEKQKMLIDIMVELLGEDRSKIVRRLIMAEAKKTASMLTGEELTLWVNLINQIAREEDYHEFAIGEAISQGMRDAYREKTGKELGYDDETALKTQADKQRVWQRHYRAKQKMLKLKELEEQYKD